MTPTETPDFNAVLGHITAWPPEVRITLARRILESVESRPASQATPRGYSAAEAIALVNSQQPAPDDDTVSRWVNEHRMEKYGR